MRGIMLGFVFLFIFNTLARAEGSIIDGFDLRVDIDLKMSHLKFKDYETGEIGSLTGDSLNAYRGSAIFNLYPPVTEGQARPLAGRLKLTYDRLKGSLFVEEFYLNLVNTISFGAGDDENYGDIQFQLFRIGREEGELLRDPRDNSIEPIKYITPLEVLMRGDIIFDQIALKGQIKGGLSTNPYYQVRAGTYIEKVGSIFIEREKKDLRPSKLTGEYWDGNVQKTRVAYVSRPRSDFRIELSQTKTHTEAKNEETFDRVDRRAVQTDLILTYSF